MRNASTAPVNQGNIDVNDGEHTRIHPAAYGLIMELLSDIYANATKAALREYTVNAWDEHRKHKVERPVEVTLPSVLQPTLSIRDFGAGIPLDGVYQTDEQGNLVRDPLGDPICLVRGAMEVFGEYGNSSKRDTNEEAGHFGIGSKAAFAMGHQFIVKGYKDGTMFKVLFTLNDDGTGSKTVMVEDRPTEEPNGIEVVIGVDDIDGMHATAREFFRFWERGTVLVDGEEPTPIFESLERVTDEIYVEPDGRGEAYAVMGPIAYPVDRDLLRKVSAYLEKQGLGEAASLPTRLVDSDTDLYLRVPIGSVKPAPSREALRDKDSTVHTLGAVFLGLHQESAVKIQNEVDAAPTFYAAAKALHEGNEALGAFKVDRSSVTWKGQKIRRTLAFEALANFTLVKKSWRTETKVVGDERRVTGLDFEKAEKTLAVVGVSEDQVGSVRRFVKRYLEANESGVERVVVVPGDAASYGWYQVGIEGGARSVTLDGWREILRTIRKHTPRTVNEPSYTVGFTSASRDLDDRDLLSDILAEQKDIVIFHDTAGRLNPYQREVLKDHTVVVLLGTQSEDALRKRIEAAREDGTFEGQVVDWEPLRLQAQANAQAVLDAVTDEEREALAARDWLQAHRGTVNGVTVAMRALSRFGEVTNASLVGAVESVALAKEFAAGISQERVDEIGQVQRYVGAIDVPEYADTFPDIQEVLPLLSFGDVRKNAEWIQNTWKKGPDGISRIAKTWYEDVETVRQRHARACRYLRHVLAYVNNA